MIKVFTAAVGHRRYDGWGGVKYSAKHYSVWMEAQASERGTFIVKQGNKIVERFEGATTHDVHDFLSGGWAGWRPVFLTSRPPKWLNVSYYFRDGWDRVNEDGLVQEVERAYQCRNDCLAVPGGARLLACAV